MQRSATEDLRKSLGPPQGYAVGHPLLFPYQLSLVRCLVEAHAK